MALETHLFRCLSDNYALLVHDPESGATLAVDAPDGAVIAEVLEQRGWRLSHIFVTHHHLDHVAGIGALTTRGDVRVIGPAAEADRIPAIAENVREGSVVSFAGRDVLVVDTPGHTAGHVAYWMPDETMAFVGDTLFAMGCGRVIEGTHAQMHHSLTKLAELPPNTKIYCGHEYTVANGRFAARVDSGNEAVRARLVEAERLVLSGEPTIPTTIAQERATNPFLRAGEPDLARAVGLEGSPPALVFAALRELKNKG